MAIEIRASEPGDWEQLSQFTHAKQFASNDFLVALSDGQFAGFLAWRRIAPDEIEILYLETLASFRRTGIARKLLRRLKQEGADLFLEVRPSNEAALQLYDSEGFIRIGLRENYYSSPPEEAIVLKFHPC